jgi:hypothetical protein
MNALEDYAIQFSTKEGSPFLNSNHTLQHLGFDAVKDVISLVSVKEIYKTHWQRFGTISKRGWIDIGYGADADSVEKPQKRYAVLINHFLVLFKKEGDPPSQALALDIHCLKKKKDDKGHLYLLLSRLHPKQAEKSHHQSVALTSSGGARNLMSKTVIGAFANVQQRVSDFRSAPKNVWTISGDDVGTTESLELWFKEMSSKCVNTGARRLFGIPLVETLNLKNKRMSHIPPLVSKVITYLDHKLETEGLFRLQGSAALVEMYRDKFELGTEVDLSECLDPHVPATILKQFFRELPEPLLLYSNYNALIDIASQKMPAETKRDKIFALLKETLPPLNMGVLLFLLGFLNRVYRMSEINKMGLANLGTVFGPNLVRTAVDDPMLLLNNTPHITELMQVLIQFEHDLTSLMAGFNPMAPAGTKSTSNTAPDASYAPTNPFVTTSAPALTQSHNNAARNRLISSVADAIAMNNSSPGSLNSSAGSAGSTSSSGVGALAPPGNGMPPVAGPAAKRIRPKGGNFGSMAPQPAGFALPGLAASGGTFGSTNSPFSSLERSDSPSDDFFSGTSSEANPGLRPVSPVSPRSATGGMGSVAGSASAVGGGNGLAPPNANGGIGRVRRSSSAEALSFNSQHSQFAPTGVATNPPATGSRNNLGLPQHSATTGLVRPSPDNRRSMFIPQGLSSLPPAPPPLNKSTPTSFAPPPPANIPRDPYTKQLEEQVQHQKEQIAAL